MNETSFTQELLHFGLFVIFAAVILASGWNEPLRYLFMKKDEIMTEERALFPDRPANRSSNEWNAAGTSLDRAPYKTNNDGLEYTNNFDGRQMGTRSETDRRANPHGKSR